MPDLTDFEANRGVPFSISEDEGYFLHRRNCVKCSKPFREVSDNPRSAVATMCVECRIQSKLIGERNRQGKRSIYRRQPLFLLPTTTGAVAELIAATDLMMRGVDVFKALDPGAPCDLIAYYADQFHRIEVRTASRRADGTFVMNRPKDPENYDVMAYVLCDGSVHYRPDVFPNRADSSQSEDDACPEPESQPG